VGATGFVALIEAGGACWSSLAADSWLSLLLRRLLVVVEALSALRLEARRDFFVRRWQSLGASLPLMVSDVFERAPSFFFPQEIRQQHRQVPEGGDVRGGWSERAFCHGCFYSLSGVAD
jgi:hypothetical protein